MALARKIGGFFETRSTPSRRREAGRTPAARSAGVVLLVVGIVGFPSPALAAGPVGTAAAEPTAAWPLLLPGTPILPHAPGRAPRPVLRSPPPARIEVDHMRRTITLVAEATPTAFLASGGPDDRYHALVSRSGGAVGKSLMATDVNDRQIAEALRSLGADDAGGVPMSAWNRRAIPFLPGPGSRVAGTRVEVLVTWEGARRSYTLGELLGDPGPGEVEIRFGGNEEHDHHWPSGCIICLYSCPGGVLSNALRTIRDHSRGHSFAPTDLFPPDGTLLTVTLQVLPG